MYLAAVEAKQASQHDYKIVIRTKCFILCSSTVTHYDHRQIVDTIFILHSHVNIQHNLQATYKHLNVFPISGCSISINHDLPEPQPLLLIPGGSKDVHGFYLPEGADGIVTLAAGQRMLLACPGNNNGFINTNIGLRTAMATCISSTIFFVNLASHNFSNFACRSHPFHTARYSGSKCYDGTKRHIEIGFLVELDFYKLIDICFDDVLRTTLYARATIVSGIAGFQRGFPRPSFIQGIFFPGMQVNNLYTQNTQRETINGLLGLPQSGNQFINEIHFLSRGHLSARADFVYGSKQRATFHFVNVAPQWQTFNGGNWEALESSVRAYADKKKLDLVVYTGTYGVATLPNVNGIETELYLYVDRNNNKAIPVPKFYWKAVYDPKRQVGVVFVGINNPHVSVLQGNDRICTDVCSKISWVRWDQRNITRGYSYCCEVDDFRSTVKILPPFPVSGLLTGAENTNDSSSLRIGQYFTLIVLMAGILKFL